jgi:alpha-glucosidase
VLPGSRIGHFAAFARRVGNEWWVAILNGTDQPMKYRLDPGFLGTGAWHATTVDDVRRKPDQMNVSQSEWHAVEAIELSIEGGGGFVARLKQ